MILAALGRRLPASALLRIRPATILGWHRALVPAKAGRYQSSDAIIGFLENL